MDGIPALDRIWSLKCCILHPEEQRDPTGKPTNTQTKTQTQRKCRLCFSKCAIFSFSWFFFMTKLQSTWASNNETRIPNPQRCSGPTDVTALIPFASWCDLICGWAPTLSHFVQASALHSGRTRQAHTILGLHPSSLRPSDKTQKQLVRCLTQARTAKKGVTLQDVSCLFRKEHCEFWRRIAVKETSTLHLARSTNKLPSEGRDAPNGTSGWSSSGQLN